MEAIVRDSSSPRAIPDQYLAKLCKHLQNEFLPYNYKSTLFQRLHKLRQGNRSITEYLVEFYQLTTRVDLTNTQDQLVSRFLAGLQLNLQDTLNLLSPATLSEAHQRGLLLEKQQARRPGSTRAPRV